MDEYSININYIRNCTKFFGDPTKEFTLSDNDVVWCHNIAFNYFVEYFKKNTMKNVTLIFTGLTYPIENYITKENYIFLMNNIKEVIVECTILPDHPKLTKIILIHNETVLNFKHLSNVPKTKGVYISHGIYANPIERTFFRVEPEAHSKNIEDFYLEMAQHKYVLCSTSSGLFSNRITEAIILGCIPITKMPKNAIHRFEKINIFNLPGQVVFPIGSNDRIQIEKTPYISPNKIYNSIDLLLMPKHLTNYRMTCEEAQSHVDSINKLYTSTHSNICTIEPWNL